MSEELHELLCWLCFFVVEHPDAASEVEVHVDFVVVTEENLTNKWLVEVSFLESIFVHGTSKVDFLLSFEFSLQFREEKAPYLNAHHSSDGLRTTKPFIWPKCEQELSDRVFLVSFKKVENHYDYLIRMGRLDKLKREGRVVNAQATTSERCQITLSQQLRWHYLIEGGWAHLRVVNQPTEEFNKVHHHFQLNLDEACFMCSDGELKIAGVGDKKTS